MNEEVFLSLSDIWTSSGYDLKKLFNFIDYMVDHPDERTVYALNTLGMDQTNREFVTNRHWPENVKNMFPRLRQQATLKKSNNLLAATIYSKVKQGNNLSDNELNSYKSVTYTNLVWQRIQWGTRNLFKSGSKLYVQDLNQVKFRKILHLFSYIHGPDYYYFYESKWLGFHALFIGANRCKLIENFNVSQFDSPWPFYVKTFALTKKIRELAQEYDEFERTMGVDLRFLF